MSSIIFVFFPRSSVAFKVYTHGGKEERGVRWHLTSNPICLMTPEALTPFNTRRLTSRVVSWVWDRVSPPLPSLSPPPYVPFVTVVVWQRRVCRTVSDFGPATRRDTISSLLTGIKVNLNQWEVLNHFHGCLHSPKKQFYLVDRWWVKMSAYSSTSSWQREHLSVVTINTSFPWVRRTRQKGVDRFERIKSFSFILSLYIYGIW